MKNVYLLISTLISLFFANKSIAATPNVNIDIHPPPQGINPDTPIGLIIGNLITIILVVGIIAVLFMLVFGAFEWITSGGDKDSVAKARGRILNAIIGLILLSLAFLLSSVIGTIVGIDLPNLTIPSLGQFSVAPGIGGCNIGNHGC